MGKIRACLLILALLVTFGIATYHAGTLPQLTPPPKARPEVVARSRFLPRDQTGINHLILFGSAYERGLASGRLTKPMLEVEESLMMDEFVRFFPSPLARWAILFGSMRWFSGIQDYIATDALNEMYGVAKSTSPKLDRLADPYTRQLAYHGVHEVGQMFVDFDKEGFGCTAMGVPFRGSWLIGRNFDFEAVRYFDTEKIAKWVFPDHGNAYVSVIWAGMVGAVTGVNDHGVYISINAAGTTDFRRLGTPTTLLTADVLEHANSAQEAVQKIVAAKVIISEIFVIADREDQGFYIVEKTPKRAHVIRHKEAAAVANHFTGEIFAEDPINRFRREAQTSTSRQERADELVTQWQDDTTDPQQSAAKMANMLRDKHGKSGAPLHLGHRGAIDALIATHSVIYDAANALLWISQGPALVGPYLGYDLATSFATGKPTEAGQLSSDSSIDASTYTAYQAGMLALRQGQIALKQNTCDLAQANIERIASSPAQEHYEYLMLAGDFEKQCQQDIRKARELWHRSLAASPAYRQHRERLQEVLQ